MLDNIFAISVLEDFSILKEAFFSVLLKILLLILLSLYNSTAGNLIDNEIIYLHKENNEIQLNYYRVVLK